MLEDIEKINGKTFEEWSLELGIRDPFDTKIVSSDLFFYLFQGWFHGSSSDDFWNKYEIELEPKPLKRFVMKIFAMVA
jgi:hypothetical protein